MDREILLQVKVRQDTIPFVEFDYKNPGNEISSQTTLQMDEAHKHGKIDSLDK